MSLSNKSGEQNRDQETGRYDYDGNLDRLCVCGHTLGIHCATNPHECFLPTYPPYTPCDCAKFRQSRKKKVANV